MVSKVSWFPRFPGFLRFLVSRVSWFSSGFQGFFVSWFPGFPGFFVSWFRRFPNPGPLLPWNSDAEGFLVSWFMSVLASWTLALLRMLVSGFPEV